MNGPVTIAAKLRPPTPRLTGVQRPQLVARLEDPASGLSVIVAPTGWGKSQLIAEWLASTGRPVAYIGLDRWDNDPTRCWAHLLAAIGQAIPVDVTDLAASLRAPALPLSPEIVEPLVARLEGNELTIVVEDFHMITSPEVIESVEALIDLAPPGVEIVVVSRAEPPLHLPRRRVSNRLNEIRLSELRMGIAEARTLMTDATDRDLDDELLQLLVDRTEGWPAGLYLAGLSLRGADDPRRFVESFAGDNQMISEYLSSEVLAGLNEEDRRFLLGTAVLTELDAATCDELLGATDSAARLEQLSRTNQFLIQTDTAKRTYRYHHLFGDWLQLEAERVDPNAVENANRRAAEIYSSHNEHRLAVDHALAGGATDLAYALVARSGVGLLDTGHHSTVARWCAQLPETDDPNQAADLAAMRGWMAILDGDLDAIAHHCRVAEGIVQSKPWASRFGLGDAGEIDLIRSYGLLLGGHFDNAASTAAAARSSGVAESGEAALCYVEAAVAYFLGQPDENRFRTAGAISVRNGVPFSVLLAEGYLGLIALDNHDVASARALADASFATARATGLESFGYAAICHLLRARIRMLDGDAEGALTDAERAVELARRRSDVPIACLAGIVVANAQHDLGHHAASETLHGVATDVDTLPSPGILRDRLRVVERQLRLPARHRPRRHDRPVEELTDRELRLLRLLPGTLSQRELGDALHVSFNTVKTYNRQIYRKLGVTSRDEAVAEAQTLGLL